VTRVAGQHLSRSRSRLLATRLPTRDVRSPVAIWW